VDHAKRSIKGGFLALPESRNKQKTIEPTHKKHWIQGAVLLTSSSGTVSVPARGRNAQPGCDCHNYPLHQKARHPIAL